MISKIINFFFEKIPFLKKFEKIISYAWISLIVTIIDVSLLFGLTEFLKINYLVSATCSYSTGTIIAYFLQKKYTFKNKNKKILLQFYVFAIISIVGLFINLFVLKILVDYTNMWYLFAKGFAIVFGFIWNYTANKNITFKKI